QQRLALPHEDSPGRDAARVQSPTVTEDRPFYAPNHASRTREPKPGVTMWTLRKDGRVMTCELRDDSATGAGWDVQLLTKGEMWLGQRCPLETGARFLAEGFRRDFTRDGWIDLDGAMILARIHDARPIRSTLDTAR